MGHYFEINIVLMAAIIIASVSQIEKVLTTAEFKVPTFQIDLWTQPRERWKEVAEHFRPKLNKSIYDCLTVLSAKHKINENELLLKFEELGRAVAEQDITKTYMQEAEGFAHYANIPKSFIFFLQLMYDFAMTSTSSVSFSGNQEIWTIKTLNFDAYSVVRDLAIIVEFEGIGPYHRDKLKAVTIAGLVGVIIGFGSTVGSASINRIITHDNILQRLDVATNLAKTDRNVFPLTFYIRESFEKTLQNDEQWIKYQVLTTSALYFLAYRFYQSSTGYFGTYFERSSHKTIARKMKGYIRNPSTVVMGNYEEGNLNLKNNDTSYWNLKHFMENSSRLKWLTKSVIMKAAEAASEKDTAFWVVICRGSFCENEEPIVGIDRKEKEK